MMASFRAMRVFQVTGRGVVVEGVILGGGTIKPGMDLVVPLNSSMSLRFEIASVEYVDHPGGKGDVGLVLSGADKETAALVMGLNIGDEVLEVAMPEDAQGP
jgi:hypothetical protein